MYSNTCAFSPKKDKFAKIFSSEQLVKEVVLHVFGSGLRVSAYCWGKLSGNPFTCTHSLSLGKYKRANID